MVQQTNLATFTAHPQLPCWCHGANSAHTFPVVLGFKGTLRRMPLCSFPVNFAGKLKIRKGGGEFFKPVSMAEYFYPDLPASLPKTNLVCHNKTKKRLFTPVALLPTNDYNTSILCSSTLKLVARPVWTQQCSTLHLSMHASHLKFADGLLPFPQHLDVDLLVHLGIALCLLLRLHRRSQLNQVASTAPTARWLKLQAQSEEKQSD